MSPQSRNWVSTQVSATNDVNTQIWLSAQDLLLSHIESAAQIEHVRESSKERRQGAFDVLNIPIETQIAPIPLFASPAMSAAKSAGAFTWESPRIALTAKAARASGAANLWDGKWV